MVEINYSIIFPVKNTDFYPNHVEIHILEGSFSGPAVFPSSVRSSPGQT
jgi:hypothetical protein